MAYVSNMDTEDEKNQSQGAVAPGGASNTVKTAPGAGVGQVGGSPTSGASNAQSGGQFATLQNYVNANQGQAAPLANQITSGIQNQYNTLQNQNQQTLSGIGNQVSQGYTKQNQDILAQEAANPVSFAANPSNIASFQSQLTDQYKGPSSAESTADYSKQLANVNNAIAQGQTQVGSDAGRQQLLQQYEARPTAGVTGLNSAILAKDPNAQANIEKAYQPFSNLVSGLQSGANDINTQIGQAQTEAQKASEAANKQISDQISTLNNTINQTAAQDEAARLANNQAITNAQLTWAQPNAFINSASQYLTSNGGAALTNPVAPYVNANPFNTPATASNVATADQYAQAGAFQNLLNGLNLGIQSPVLDQNQINQAGTYQAPNMLPTLDNKATADQIWRNWIQNYNQLTQKNPGLASKQPVSQDATNLFNSLLQFDPNLRQNTL